MSDTIYFILILTFIAACWWQAIRAHIRHPHRFSKPRAVWQIAKRMAREHERGGAGAVISSKEAKAKSSLSPISFW